MNEASEASEVPEEHGSHQHVSALNRTPSVAEDSTASSIHRSSSVSSYQPSLITPCSTTQSTPELYGAKVELNSSDWGSDNKLSPEFLATLDDRTIALQNDIHNLIKTEENYVVNTKVYLEVFGSGLADTLEKGREKFRQDAFVTLEAVLKVNEDMLLKPLKADKEANGPILQFNTDIVKSWAIAVREPILYYGERYPYANEVVQTEKTSNERFKAFIDHGSTETTKSIRKEFSSLIENTRTRFGQYSMMFSSILKLVRKMNEEDPIIPEIEECIRLIKETMTKYNLIQGEIGTQLELARLGRSLRFKNREDRVDLNLTDGGHEILYRGKIKLRNDVEVDSLEMILLDHFLLLVNVRSESEYIITTKPIHMELLVIESVSDDPMFKSSTMAVVSKLTRNKSDGAALNSSRTNSVASAPPNFSAAQGGGPTSPNSRNKKTSGSISSIPANSEFYTSVSLSHNSNLIYPIKLRNLATDQKYYICTVSEITRKEWVKRICEAKAKYSQKAHNLRYEPFSMRIIDSTSFGYSQLDVPKGSIFTKDNALYRALQEHKDIVSKHPVPMSAASTNASVATSSTLAPITSGSTVATASTVATRSRMPGIKTNSSIQCCAVVVYNNMQIMFLGLNDALYGCQIQHPEVPLNWVLIELLPRVHRIEAVEDKNMLFVLSEKSLLLFKFNEVILKILTSGSIQSATKVALTPPTVMDQNVDCFKAGMLSNVPYLFYSSYGNKSTVTVLEITGKDPNKKSSRLFAFKNKTHGNEFKECDWLFTPTRNREITFFNSTFCIHTDNSFEVMNLERKQPCSIPVEESILRVARKQGLPEPQAEQLRKRINEARPVSIDKVPSRAVGPTGVSVGNDFLLCYHKFAIMCDALGDLESAVAINYLRKITAAHAFYPYLVTFSDRVIEIRKLTGGADVHQLVQIVTGRDIRMLGVSQAEKDPRLVFAMTHPEQRQRQLVLEFVMNQDINPNQSENTLTYLS